MKPWPPSGRRGCLYGTSLALLLDAALDSAGDIAYLEAGRLDQLDRPQVDP